MTVTVRPMETESEILGKAYVHWKTWQEAYADLIPADYLERFTLDRCEAIARKWPDNLLVAKDGERVVGFCGYGAYRDDSLPDTGEIFALYVLSEYRGSGVGAMLMGEALKRLDRFPSVALWVLRDNGRAIRFYEKQGFVPDGTEQTVSLGAPLWEIRMIRSR